MRVLEGRRTFAKGLGQIEFKGFKKTFISKKSFFVLFFILYFIVWRGESTKK